MSTTPSSTALLAALSAGVEHHRAGRLGEAEAIYRDVLAGYPRFPEVLYNLGLLLLAQSRLEEAEIVLEDALHTRPVYPEAMTALGNVLQGRDQLERAIELYDKALALKPGAAELHNNLGTALKACDRLDEARTHLEEAVRINPRFAEAFYNLGNVLVAQRQLGEAAQRYRRAIAIAPLNAPAFNNLGSTLKEQGLLVEAADAYRQAIDLSPNFADPQHNLLFSLIYRADLSPAAIAEAHLDWAFRHVDRALPPPPPFANTREPARRLRVGYVSPDFQTHPVATFFEPLLAAHDARAVECFCYSDTGRADATTARLKAKADHWRETRGRSSAVVAEMVRQDGIDLLVDLAGHTAYNRLALFACQPAPVQITWLGYPATTGLAAMGYRITDAVADPAGAEPHHSESLLRLPSGFLCYGPAVTAPDVAPLPARAPGAVTFGSFNNFSKLSDDTIALWSRVLAMLPQARLVLKGKQAADADTVRRLGDAFAARGVARERVQFLPIKPAMADHLATYGTVDIALDPFPYNGTTTSCDALWMGVPVITLRGSAHAGRVGASLLARLGLTELIAETGDDYLRIAQTLADDLPRLASLRTGLRDRMRTTICDADRFAREMEQAYRDAWQRWCAAEVLS